MIKSRKWDGEMELVSVGIFFEKPGSEKGIEMICNCIEIEIELKEAVNSDQSFILVPEMSLNDCSGMTKDKSAKVVLSSSYCCFGR